MEIAKNLIFDSLLNNFYETVKNEQWKQ